MPRLLSLPVCLFTCERVHLVSHSASQSRALSPCSTLLRRLPYEHIAGLCRLALVQPLPICAWRRQSRYAPPIYADKEVCMWERYLEVTHMSTLLCMHACVCECVDAEQPGFQARSRLLSALRWRLRGPAGTLGQPVCA